MTVGTKSLLFGAHAFFLHPLFVAWGWKRLWTVPWNPRLWICFLVHDVGYFGRESMDGEGSEQHVVAGAKIAGLVCGSRYASECYRHSREWCRHAGQSVSRLCLADKMAFVLTPWWIYLPMARLTGELDEYMKRSREEWRRDRYTDKEYALIFGGGAREWLEGLQSYTKRWVEEQLTSLHGTDSAVAGLVSRAGEPRRNSRLPQTRTAISVERPFPNQAQ